MLSKIAEAVGLQDGATEAEIVTAIEELRVAPGHCAARTQTPVDVFVPVDGAPHELSPGKGYLTIICRNPGMWRCGVAHPAIATYPEGRWPAEDLIYFEADPAFDVLQGTTSQPIALSAGEGEMSAPIDPARIYKIRSRLAELAEAILAGAEDGRVHAGFRSLSEEDWIVAEGVLGFRPTPAELDAAVIAAFFAMKPTLPDYGDDPAYAARRGDVLSDAVTSEQRRAAKPKAPRT